jgi:hypothetical protein
VPWPFIESPTFTYGSLEIIELLAGEVARQGYAFHAVRHSFSIAFELRLPQMMSWPRYNLCLSRACIIKSIPMTDVPLGVIYSAWSSRKFRKKKQILRHPLLFLVIIRSRSRTTLAPLTFASRSARLEYHCSHFIAVATCGYRTTHDDSRQVERMEL